MAAAAAGPAVGPAGPPAQRVRQKTTPQDSLPEPLSLDEEAEQNAKTSVWLVTFTRPLAERAGTGERLAAPGSKTREQMMEAFLDACANPVRPQQGRAAGQTALPRLAAYFQEYHRPDPDSREQHQHGHLAVKFGGSVRFLPIKKALLARRGLASHWKGGFSGYWQPARRRASPFRFARTRPGRFCDAKRTESDRFDLFARGRIEPSRIEPSDLRESVRVRYCGLAPPPKEPAAALDPRPVLWAPPGEKPHPAILDSTREPATAAAMTARRLRADSVAAEQRKEPGRLTDGDVWALAARSGARNTPDDRAADRQLALFAKQRAGQAMVEYLFNRRNTLNSVIDDIWAWEEIDDSTAQQCQATRLEAKAAAARGDCVCRGQWLSYATSSMVANGVPLAELCYDIHVAMQAGRPPAIPMVVLAGSVGGEGKSIFLRALLNVFATHRAVSPAPSTGNPPLLHLPEAKVCFLDEYRFNPDIASCPLQQLRFDGGALPLSRPQNEKGCSGHFLHKGSAPVFITTTLADLDALEAAAQPNPATGKPFDTEASMLMRRLKIFRFNVRQPKPAATLPHCPRCFARLVIGQATAYAAAAAPPAPVA
ncbi:unnamed protein product [Prorocentrum cordatum]|uniref:Uncharacterized protein n=1 Tax=Prorocentrum cordatum TaxID=2364126 RepID=A0ABN9T9Y0_9DINO|nr:unnamed protein product [Polarella glacialis]